MFTMTGSDKEMDRALTGLMVLPPPRSVWSAVDSRLIALEKRERRVRMVKVAVPAIAASVLVVVGLLGAVSQTALKNDSAMQKTVDIAVRNARPAATYSGHVVADRHARLETLLVSGKPRSGGAQGAYIGAGSGTGGDDKPADKASKKLNEF